MNVLERGLKRADISGECDSVAKISDQTRPRREKHSLFLIPQINTWSREKQKTLHDGRVFLENELTKN